MGRNTVCQPAVHFRCFPREKGLSECKYETVFRIYIHRGDNRGVALLSQSGADAISCAFSMRILSDVVRLALEMLCDDILDMPFRFIQNYAIHQFYRGEYSQRGRGIRFGDLDMLIRISTINVRLNERL